MNDFMVSKTFYHYAKMRDADRGKSVMPVSCEIDISNKCNLDCSFCMFKDFRASTSALLEWSVFVNLLQQLRNVGCRSITFTGGGEPTIHPQFDQMVIFAHSVGFDIGLVTNGTHLERVSKPTIFKFIRVSLDASNPKDYIAIKKRDRFGVVIEGIKYLKRKGAFVGLSYVVCKENSNGTERAQNLADILKVEYIQFKPAYTTQGGSYDNYALFDHGKTINTERYVAKSMLPCRLAGLVGIVTADADVCFCCQHRGKLIAGSLKTETFKTLWERRNRMLPDITKCPPCRYMAYAKAYEDFQDKYSSMFWDHKNFL